MDPEKLESQSAQDPLQHLGLIDAAVHGRRGKNNPAISMMSRGIALVREYGVVDLPDLKQESYLGVQTATEKHDASIAKFAGFALWYIGSVATTELGRQLTIRPSYRDWRAVLNADSEEEKTLENYAIEFEQKPDTISSQDNEALVPVHDVADSSSQDHLELAEYHQIIDQHDIWSLLSDQQKQAVKMRYGFIDGTEWSIDDIAAELGVTKQRIHQVIKRAKQKIRKQLGVPEPTK